MTFGSRNRRGLLHLLDGRLVEEFPWARLGSRTAGGPASRGPLARRSLARIPGRRLWFISRMVRVRESYTAANGLGEGRVQDLQARSRTVRSGPQPTAGSASSSTAALLR